MDQIHWDLLLVVFRRPTWNYTLNECKQYLIVSASNKPWKKNRISWLLSVTMLYHLPYSWQCTSDTSVGLRVSGFMPKYLQGQHSVKPKQSVGEEEKTQLILFVCFHCFCSSWKIMSFQISFDISMMLNRFGEITNILTGFLGNEMFMKLICHELIWLI